MRFIPNRIKATSTYFITLTKPSHCHPYTLRPQSTPITTSADLLSAEEIGARSCRRPVYTPNRRRERDGFGSCRRRLRRAIVRAGERETWVWRWSSCRRAETAMAERNTCIVCVSRAREPNASSEAIKAAAELYTQEAMPFHFWTSHPQHNKMCNICRRGFSLKIVLSFHLQSAHNEPGLNLPDKKKNKKKKKKGRFYKF
ncbi:hypothetical protein Dsin_010406 [Dipteronia sinensis]|uniref:C2H2-type domain-containing protein n=1 Tax=Dipteronia sinensis TaxID=43782 RepID=A0AAE0ASH1_9ROSI|nr:hypothetical protein Dsin_010406 [Dipteronia sinensis]